MNKNTTYPTASGIKVQLEQLELRRTWLVLLIGTPEYVTQRWRAEENAGLHRKLREPFPWVKATLVVDEGWPAFPRWHWMALFEGPALHTQNSGHESQLAICWFTDALPNDFEALLSALVRAIDWENVAEDFDATF